MSTRSGAIEREGAEQVACSLCLREHFSSRFRSATITALALKNRERKPLVKDGRVWCCDRCTARLYAEKRALKDRSSGPPTNMVRAQFTEHLPLFLFF